MNQIEHKIVSFENLFEYGKISMTTFYGLLWKTWFEHKHHKCKITPDIFIATMRFYVIAKANREYTLSVFGQVWMGD